MKKTLLIILSVFVMVLAAFNIPVIYNAITNIFNLIRYANYDNRFIYVMTVLNETFHGLLVPLFAIGAFVLGLVALVVTLSQIKKDNLSNAAGVLALVSGIILSVCYALTLAYYCFANLIDFIGLFTKGYFDESYLLIIFIQFPLMYGSQILAQLALIVPILALSIASVTIDRKKNTAGETK